MQPVIDLVCGAGFVTDWNAVSALATTAAVLVALWLPARDRRQRRLERLESEARAAGVIDQKLAGLTAILPDVLALIANSDGTLVDNPGSEVIYGIDACKSLLDRETFCHQLPIAHVGRGELVCALARKWCADVDVRRQTQRDPQLTAIVDWGKHDSLRRLGDALESEGLKLRVDCQATMTSYERARVPYLRRVLLAAGGLTQRPT